MGVGAWGRRDILVEWFQHSTEKGWALGPSFCLFHILHLERLLIKSLILISRVIDFFFVIGVFIIVFFGIVVFGVRCFFGIRIGIIRRVDVTLTVRG
ncbi:hypothetical protein C8U37_102136 [Trichococcus patagoniensis]|uniref:Uncharacterized protein n=1 Tax=Trichococcus patagoniensis TaxID=382641 RepID=A0A2T5IQD9_9LACT|nr:hypothetical protein C8U37_102136 [Trichococcus patagoniensis]